ncbi:MAG: SMP-30/gluconolactonase/LRE family protein [Novosphingobium sp.]|nr:SMP-30/gluconolactonase/LRE family protein [Novosphingobium sp.]
MRMPVARHGLLAAAGLALAACAADARAPGELFFPERDVFPESITADASGALFAGSAANGSIYRVKPGESTASVWIPGSKSGIAETLGVFADDASGTLYACSIGLGAPPDKADALSALYAFDLSTGEVKARYALPGGAKAVCNDIATDGAGNAYVSDIANGRVLLLRKGATTLEEWLADPVLAGVNGVAVGNDGALYVDTMASGKLFRIAIANGHAGTPEAIATPRPLERPDGLRALGRGRFLLAENGGHLSLLTVFSDAKTQLVPLAEGAGWSSAAFAGGRYWAVNSKAEYRMDPAFAGKDPNPFRIDAIDPPE